MSYLKIIVIVLAIGVGVYFLVDWLHLSDEEQVEALILQGREAVEKGDLPVIDELISPSYDFEGKNKAVNPQGIVSTINYRPCGGQIGS